MLKVGRVSFHTYRLPFLVALMLLEGVQAPPSQLLGMITLQFGGLDGFGFQITERAIMF